MNTTSELTAAEQRAIDAWDAVHNPDMDHLEVPEYWVEFRKRNEELAEAYDNLRDSTPGTLLALLLIDAGNYRRSGTSRA